MAEVYKGSCLCGQTAFEVQAKPITVSICHCTNCKKYTGTVFTKNVVFPAGTFKITKGEDIVKTYHDAVQDSGNALDRVFCGNCASPLYCRGGDGGTTLAVFYSALDNFDAPGHERPPQVEYYSKDRAAWMHPVEGAEQPRTKPGRADA